MTSSLRRTPRRINLDIPWWLMGLSILILIFGIIGLRTTNSSDNSSDPGDYILLFTLEILLFYTYYTYLLAVVSKKSIRGPALLEAQKMHTDYLKSELNDMKTFLDRINSRFYDAGRDPKSLLKLDEDFINRVNTSLSEFTEYHFYLLPDGDKLSKNWCKFNKLVSKTINMHQNLYNMVIIIPNIEMQKQYKSHELEMVSIHDSYYDLICEQLITSKYDSDSAEYTISRDIVYLRFHNMNMRHDIRLLEINRRNGGEQPETGINDKLDLAISIHKKMMFTLNGCGKYKVLCEKINGDLEEIFEDGLRSVLLDNISSLLRYPLYPGTECDSLKIWK